MIGGAWGESPIDGPSTMESTWPQCQASYAVRYKASMRWVSSDSVRRRVFPTREEDGDGVRRQA